MCSVIVVEEQPLIQINLQLFNRPIYLASEGNLVKLLQDCLVKPLADTIRLRVHGLCLGMLNVVQGQIELIVMRFCLACIFSSIAAEHSYSKRPPVLIQTMRLDVTGGIHSQPRIAYRFICKITLQAFFADALTLLLSLYAPIHLPNGLGLHLQSSDFHRSGNRATVSLAIGW